MKRIVCLALALALAACAAPAPQSGTEAPAPATAETAALTVGQLYTLPDTCGGYWGWNTGDAYYEYARDGQPNSMAALTLKTDYATGRQEPVCKVPGCTHDSERCPAWLADWGRISLMVFDDEMYFLYYALDPESRQSYQEQGWEGYLQNLRGSEEYAAAGDKAAYEERARRSYEQAISPSYLEKISADGLTRTRLFTLPEGMDWDVSFRWSDGAALYGVQYGSNHTSALVRLDLATGELTTLPLRDTEWPLTVSGNRFLISSVVSDEPLDWNSEPEVLNAQLQNATAVFSLLDVAADTREVVYQEPYDPITVYNGFSRIYNGKLYFLRVSAVDNTIDRVWVECYDPADGQLHPVTDSLGTAIASPGTASGFPPVRAGAGNRWMWLENYMTNEDWLLDLDTGELHEITQRQLRDGMWQTVSTMAQTNDGRWMIGYAPHSAAHNDRCDYGFIAPEDFLAGSEQYDRVEMWP